MWPSRTVGSIGLVPFDDECEADTSRGFFESSGSVEAAMPGMSAMLPLDMVTGEAMGEKAAKEGVRSCLYHSR